MKKKSKDELDEKRSFTLPPVSSFHPDCKQHSSNRCQRLSQRHHSAQVPEDLHRRRFYSYPHPTLAVLEWHSIEIRIVPLRSTPFPAEPMIQRHTFSPVELTTLIICFQSTCPLAKRSSIKLFNSLATLSKPITFRPERRKKFFQIEEFRFDLPKGSKVPHALSHECCHFHRSALLLFLLLHLRSRWIIDSCSSLDEVLLRSEEYVKAFHCSLWNDRIHHWRKEMKEERERELFIEETQHHEWERRENVRDTNERSEKKRRNTTTTKKEEERLMINLRNKKTATWLPALRGERRERNGTMIV